MPSGALVQLVSKGIQDKYLIGNPTTTFFKTVYKRHTNFAIEASRQPLNGIDDFGKKLTCVLNKEGGDLINNMYLEIVLPTINQTQQGSTWISYSNGIANVLVKSIELEIGGVSIDRHYSEWLDIWGELNVDANYRESYDEMVGNYASDTALIYSSASSTSYTQYRTYYMPLRFWFNRSIGNSLPLIALQYHDIKFNIELRPLSELIHSDVILNTSSLTDTEGALLKIQSITMWGDNIYLDKEERTHIANIPHDFIIDQVQFNGAESLAPKTSSETIQLDFNNPVKAIYWILRNETYLAVNTKTGNSQIKYLGVQNSGDTFETFKIQLDGNDRFEQRYANYFRLVQSTEHSISAPRKYIYMYSFAINAGHDQPSGTCDFSRITSSLVNMTFDSRIHTAYGSVRLNLYAVNYNIFQIRNGMGSILFTN
jgi:hypothetical protein